MFLLMTVLAVAGVALLFAAPVIARLVTRGTGDPVALTRVLQVVALGLLVSALLVRPHNEETAVFKPAPDMVEPDR